MKLVFKILTVALSLTVFGVAQSAADENKDKKLKQLEALLQTYIQENISLTQKVNTLEQKIRAAANLLNTSLEKTLVDKPESQSLGTEQKTNDTPVNLSSEQKCKLDLANCRKFDLCKTATFRLNGKTQWKVDRYKIFVDEAKRRGFSCGVKTTNNASKKKISVPTPEPTTEKKLRFEWDNSCKSPARLSSAKGLLWHGMTSPVRPGVSYDIQVQGTIQSKNMSITIENSKIIMYQIVTNTYGNKYRVTQKIVSKGGAGVIQDKTYTLIECN